LKRLIDSKFVSLVAVFAAVNVIFDSLVSTPLPFSGVWYSWIFVFEPVNGIVLGPLAGFFSSLIGVMIGHYVNFVDVYEFLFTLGVPIGATISALVFRGKWKIPLIYHAALLVAFFATPIAWQLPPWGMWDTYLALACLLVIIVAMRKWKNLWDTKTRRNLIYILALSAFIGLEADVLFRIFIFIPCQTYRLFYGYDVGVLQATWVLGAVETPIKAALSALVTTMIGLPLISAARKMGATISGD